MKAVAAPIEVNFKNILYLTDFSQPSEAALPFALAVARVFGAKIYALNVLIPAGYVYTTPDLTAIALAAEEKTAIAEMKKVEARIAGLPHEVLVERATEIWEPVKHAIVENNIDLVVLGTQGRTGAHRYCFGSVAEEIFRHSTVPVLTIGPGVRTNASNFSGFRRVLFATDFSPEAAVAAPYAISLARKQDACLILVHVVPKLRAADSPDAARAAISVAEAMHRLYEIPSENPALNAPPELAIEYGDPAERIVEVAKLRDADIIVLGIRAAAGVPGAATHLERPTAHKIVVHAPCPVLAVRG
jgi:nucleotide-binding universal stress UspA family protein